MRTLKKNNLMKYFMFAFLICTSVPANHFSGVVKNSGRISKLKVTNPISIVRKDEVISIPVESLKNANTEFNENAFVVFDGKLQLPSQTEDVNGDGKAENIVILADLKENESKDLIIESDKTAVLKSEYKQRTHAEISVKTDYKLEHGIYSGGRFQNVAEVEMPKDHFAHDALYKYEGPGWESDRVAYRFYLDSRNRNDIFGKVTDRMILQEAGSKDLVSDSKESYTRMCEWGMDIFKVGESLGIGSIGMMNNGKITAISKTDKVTVKVLGDGPIRSGILTKYFNWKVDSLLFNISSFVSISAGSRLTRTDIEISGSPENICTGIAKHDGCTLLKDSSDHSWGYIASYGKQSLAGDNLGLVIFYKKSDLINITEDEASYIVILKPSANLVSYYFGAAWDKELNGIKTEKEFGQYLHDETEKISNPVAVEL